MTTTQQLDFGKLTDAQIAFLNATPWHLEAYPGDDNRLRVVYPQLAKTGRWFSRQWPVIDWTFIAPV